MNSQTEYTRRSACRHCSLISETFEFSNVPEGFIGLAFHILQWNIVARNSRSGLRAAHIWAADTLVGVGRLLCGHATPSSIAMVGRATRAAAWTQQPEKRSTKCKGNGKPGGSEHVGAHTPFDVVDFQDGVESAGEDGEQCRWSNRGSKSKAERDLWPC